jgi:hypothetical protein
MRAIKKLSGAALLAASLSGTAMADPQLGSWTSEGGDFDAGNWMEQFAGGEIGALGNLLSAAGLEACCFDLAGAELTGSERTGENAYLVTYEGATLTLPNTAELPWFMDGDGAEYVIDAMVLHMDLELDLDGEAIESMRFDVSGSGAATGFPDITVSFSAHYEGLPSLLSEEPDTLPEENGLQDLLNGASIGITRTSVARFEIKPWSCDNPLNVKSRGVLPTVIAGSESLDITTLDAASIRLAGVAPVRSSIRDILSADVEAPCDAPLPDGIDDLVIKFDVQELVNAIGGHELEDGSEVILPLTANITNEDTIVSEDFIWIINKNRKPPKGEKGKPEHAGGPTEPGNQGNGKGWGPDNNPSNDRSNGKGKDKNKD